MTRKSEQIVFPVVTESGSYSSLFVLDILYMFKTICFSLRKNVKTSYEVVQYKTKQWLEYSKL